ATKPRNPLAVARPLSSNPVVAVRPSCAVGRGGSSRSRSNTVGARGTGSRSPLNAPAAADSPADARPPNIGTSPAATTTLPALMPARADPPIPADAPAVNPADPNAPPPPPAAANVAALAPNPARVLAPIPATAPAPNPAEAPALNPAD